MSFKVTKLTGLRASEARKLIRDTVKSLGTVKAAAAELDCDRPYLYRVMKRLGMRTPGGQAAERGGAP